MSFKHTLTIVSLALSLSATTAFAASLPSNVKSVQATQGGGSVTVMWSPVPGATAYRIYYSHESILENGGNYDDFEHVSSTETIHVFEKAPLESPEIFFGVLAVNEEGLESEGFEVEASVAIPASSSSPSSVAMTEPTVVASSSEDTPTTEQPAGEMPVGESPTSTAVPMSITGVEAVSSTGVVVTFSKEVNGGVILNPGFFLITNSGGVVLPIEKVEVRGTQLLLTTAVQKPDDEYAFSLLGAIPASDGTNATPSEPRVLFRAQSLGSETTTPPPPTVPYGKNPNIPGPVVQQPVTNNNGYSRPPLMDPSNLELTAVLRKDGMYNVVANWIGSPNADAYSLYTSKDGSPYSWNSAVQRSETRVQYSRIAPGTFGVKVASRSGSQESVGVAKAINLPASGLGLFGIAALSGMGAMRRVQRKKKQVA